ncbi:GNAT family N-acetyltransferase [Clostridium akagii]|uniref:GNAT family N-acetyltransferase n=1 Tax=Clostridium akagii TaxID=91623 RepID=UPI00047CA50D|nr:GNAT family N-acetyltransferase [Clostridium akagii]
MMRKAVMEDIKDIMGIIKETIIEMQSYNNNQWDASYPQEKDFANDIQRENLFVLELKDKLVGFICINKVEPDEYNGLNWSLNHDAMVVHRMAVKPSYRRNGIGTALMKFVDELALESNIKYLKTDTYSLNLKMNNLFQKFGYKFVGEISFLGKSEPFYCYEKILKNNC